MAEAETQHSANARIERIKRAVMAEFRSIDPAVSVKFTDYFNHVVVPDMVLRWSDSSQERLLFVRPSAEISWLERDVDALSAHRPVIFTLEEISSEQRSGDESHQDGDGSVAGDVPERATSMDGEGAEDPSEHLRSAAAGADTWVADPSATAGVVAARKQSAVIGLLGQALVRGGRGVSDGRAVDQLTSSTRIAFADAETLNVSSMRTGVASIEGALDPQQAGRFTRILRAVWEGNGGLGSAFPTVSSTGPLTDDDLFYLLTTLDDATPEFWHRVGRNVTTAQLGRIRLEDPSATLQDFVGANLGSLTAKGIRATGQQVRLGESEDSPRWLIDRGCLAIRGIEWIAHLAARRAEELPPADAREGFSLERLKRRAVASNTVVTRVDFGKGDRGVSYESKDRLDILQDEDLASLAQDVPGLSVERAALAITGGAATLDIPARTALAPTSSVLPVGSLARAALPFIVDLNEDEGAAVNELLSPDGDQGDLFHDVTSNAAISTPASSADTD